MSLVRVGLAAIFGACAWCASAAPAGLSADELAALGQAPPGARVTLRAFPTGPGQSGAVRVERIEVYADDAHVYEVNGFARREIARSDWRAFVADPGVPGSPRVGFAIAPDGRQLQGVLFGENGEDYALHGDWREGKLELRMVAASARGPDGELQTGLCANNIAGDMRLPTRARFDAAFAALPDGAKIVKGGVLRQAVVAIETDGELMTQRFADNTANANAYLTALFAGMNVMYERDLDVRLLQGNVFLRTGGAGADPYSSPEGGSIFDQLDEFGEVWLATQGSIDRAFAAMISGKETNANAFSGLAWLLPGDIYCNEEGTNFPSGICPDGTCTAGHYSANRTFTSAITLFASEPRLIGHEIGHNFGANHTHCSDAVTGNGPTSTNTIDTCFNGESDCFGGTQTCPAAQTINGVPNVRGTVMSYCHLAPAGCSASAVWAPAHVTLLLPLITTNASAGCFTVAGADPVIFANGFENP
jgi:hypothetical protein